MRQSPAQLSLLALFLTLACATPRQEMAGWDHTYPEAAHSLGEWVRTHPRAAGLFFEWDAHHTERAHELVSWAIAHPAQPVDVFVAAHPGWERFDRIMETHRPAAQTFVDWCRAYPNAAQALMSRPGGLQWAGHHLYKDYWMSER